MTKQARSASWKDVKTVLSQQSMPELLQLIRDLYALRPEVKDFLHARFLTSAKTLAPYKQTIQQSLSPDVIHGEDLDLARGRKAISDYNRSYAVVESRIKKGIESPWGGKTLCLSHSGYTSWPCCILRN
jgi:hypothetical protein